jgi:phosphate transport system permease protein
MADPPPHPSASSPALKADGRLAKPAVRPAGRFGDILFRLLCKGAAILVLVLAGLLLAVLVWKSWPAIRDLRLGFLTGTRWDPEDAPGHHVFGALAFVYGTVYTSLIAMLIAVPLGIGTAAFLAEIAPGWLRRSASFLVEMLAAIPSVVYGFWGMFVLKPFLEGIIPGSGSSIFSAGLVLAVMVLPYIAAVSYDVCRAVPRSQREGSLALGATRWQTIWSVILPYARPGIIGGCFLALGRALGETMAVTMLIGNSPEIHWTPFLPGDSIPSKIANEFNESKNNPLHESVLVELGLLLLLVTVVINSLARLLIWRVGQPRTGKRSSTFQGIQDRGGIDPAVRTRLDQTLRSANAKSLWVNRLMTGVLGLCLAVSLGPLFLILGYLVVQGVGSLNWEFFVNLPLNGGLANALVGSAILVVLASLFAVPIGLFSAIFLAEYRGGRLSSSVRFVSELLGGVPSIVIGIFAAALIDRPLGGHGLAGSFALGVMMIPIVMRASEESLKLVPGSLRNASYALGGTQWQTVLKVTVPAALPAIITGVFLAIARIGGETAPLLLTAGNNNFWPNSPSDFIPSLPMFVFEYSKDPDPEKNRQAWAAAFVLLSLVMFLNFGIRLLTGKRVVSATRAD